ncbi:thiamine-phosphate kinase [Populibacterium corticicola]|uniref:Thiamine-monophosphate kinase n=1 Tax=Populibacterium corticicola TaxID=1812826 RepID=A0ABW5XAU7_9MICO
MNPPNHDADLLVGDLDESQLLARIFPLLPTNSGVLLGPGDDCAVVSAPDTRFVVSTDILIENVHFRQEWSTGYQVGWRAAMQNLADIAAMGARPTSLVVGLAIPKQLQVNWVTEFARGLGDAARQVGAAVVGGDLSGAEQIFVSVTVHGDLEGRAPVLRSGARVGDVVALAGCTGWSAAGLDVLLRGGLPEDGLDGSLSTASAQMVALALQSFLTPTSPIELGSVAGKAGATALMDVSDGLIRDAQRICAASGVEIVFDYDALLNAVQAPVHNPNLTFTGPPTQEVSTRGALPKLARLLGAANADEVDLLVAKWMLTGGEDHALLATFPSETGVPAGFATIGRVTASSVPPSTPTETRRPATRWGAVRVEGIELDADGVGWDHFR